MSEKPIPEADELWQPFFDGARNGTLMVQRCQACESHLAPGTARCTECWSESLEWVQASGQGTLFSYSIVHHIGHPGFRDEVPYVIAVVELAEEGLDAQGMELAVAGELRPVVEGDRPPPLERESAQDLSHGAGDGV